MFTDVFDYLPLTALVDDQVCELRRALNLDTTQHKAFRSADAVSLTLRSRKREVFFFFFNSLVKLPRN